MQTLALAGIGTLMVAGAACAADAPAPAPAPYTLFMGADFALQRDDGMFRVLNVVGSSFVIREGNKIVHVHAGAVPVNIEIKRALKMMPGSARLDGYHWERDYMAGTNPEQKAATAYANLVGEMQDELTSADRGVAGAYQYTPLLGNGVVPSVVLSSSPTQPVPIAILGNNSGPVQAALSSGNAATLAQAEDRAASETLQEDTFSANAYNHAQQDAAASDGRNAIHIQFEVSSPIRLAKPYAMFVAVIHAPKHEHQKQQWIGGTEVDPVLPGHAVKVDYFQGGFPAGFQVDKLTVYLFDDGGREIGTNLSNDRVGLTREQAFQYLVIDYLEDHRHSTLPATPAMTKLPADWRAHVGDAWFQQTYFVKVDKNGHAQGIFTDPECRQPANAYLAGMITGVWFRPALKEGKPVETVAQVVPQTLVE